MDCAPEQQHIANDSSRCVFRYPAGAGKGFTGYKDWQQVFEWVGGGWAQRLLFFSSLFPHLFPVRFSMETILGDAWILRSSSQSTFGFSQFQDHPRGTSKEVQVCKPHSTPLVARSFWASPQGHGLGILIGHNSTSRVKTRMQAQVFESEAGERKVRAHMIWGTKVWRSATPLVLSVGWNDQSKSFEIRSSI